MGEELGKWLVILADVSGSMSDRAQEGTKIERLREALGSIWAETPGASLIAFNGNVMPLEGPDDLPSPTGGTALHLALRAAAAMRAASVVVISDGRPDDEEAALDVAREIPGAIDALYVGPEDDAQAIAFMKKLGRIGGGTVVVKDLLKCRSIVAPLRSLLGLPAPK